MFRANGPATYSKPGFHTQRAICPSHRFSASILRQGDRFRASTNAQRAGHAIKRGMALDTDSEFSKLVGFTAAALVAAYFFSPVLSRFPPAVLIWLGMLSAAGLVWLYRIWAGGRILGWISLGVGFACLGLAVLIGASTLETVRSDADANDRRCLAIQRDMLSANPRRSDGPDLFQALGCRPQGEGSVYASPRKR